MPVSAKELADTHNRRYSLFLTLAAVLFRESVSASMMTATLVSPADTIPSYLTRS